jgi:hypothetical protein
MTVPRQHLTGCSGYGNDKNNKRELSLQPESLFSMAMYDMDYLSQQQLQQQDLEPLPANAEPAFYPVDEYSHLSLRELLELSDDYLFGEFGEEEENNMSHCTMLNSVLLNEPRGQNVASHAVAAFQANTEPIVSMHVGNQMQPTMDRIEPTPLNEWRVPMMPTSCKSDTKKCHREEPSDDESDEDLNHEGRFRPYHAGQWEERFSSLCLYRQKHGNCLVPHTYKDDLPLARWVKRQRYQYKLMIEGKSSTMTGDRVKALEEINFVWDSQGAAWGERLEELKKFQSIHMHCNVPSNYRENPQLATWVKCQRRQYKLHMEGKASNITPQRNRDLEAVGFEWMPRSYKKQRTM